MMMKRNYATISPASAVLFGTQTEANSYDLRNDITSEAISMEGADLDSDIQIYLAFTNNNQTATDVRVKCYEMNIINSTKDYFCWAICYEV